MKTPLPVALAAVAALCGALCRADIEEAKLTAPGTPLLQARRDPGLTFEVRCQSDTRELRAPSAPMDLEAIRISARAGYEFLPFLQASIEAGWSRAHVDSEPGEGGFCWGAAACLNAYEYVIRSSPVIGTKESTRLAAIVSYQHAQSNFGTTDFVWNELLIVPFVDYRVCFRGPENWHPYDPLAAAVRAGIVFSSIDGEYGSAAVKENRNFGFTVGADLQIFGGGVISLETRFYNEGDVSSCAALGYHF